MKDQEPDAGLHRDHLGRDQQEPGGPGGQPQASDDHRQRRRQHDLADHAEAPGAEGHRGADQQRLGLTHAGVYERLKRQQIPEPVSRTPTRWKLGDLRRVPAPPMGRARKPKRAKRKGAA